jgi:hypothetical protein
MENIVKKEFEWGKMIRIRVIVSIIIGIVLSISFITSESYLFGSGEATILDKIIGVIFAGIAILCFAQYLYMRKNKFYIQITDDEIKKSSVSVDFDFSSGVTEWKDISRIEKNPGGITLIVNGENDIRIRFNYLKKDDRENLVQIIQEHIDNKPTA